MTRLPTQLRRQIKETNELESAIRKEVGTKKFGTTEFVKEVDEASVDEDNAAATVQTEEAAPAPVHDQNAGAAESPSEPSPEPSPEPPLEPDWKQKYLTLQGKYTAEVPRMAEDIRNYNDQIAQLQQQINELRQPTPEPAPEQTYLSSRDTEDYGENMVDFALRAARQAVNKDMQELRDQLTTLQSQMQQVQQTTQHVQQRQVSTEVSTMNSYLDQHVPDWRRLDSDSEFVSWSNQRDPFSGETRGNLLRTAYKQGDAVRVAHIFNAFKQENRPQTPVQPVSPEPQRKPAVAMETLVTPTPSSGASQPAPADSEPTQQKPVYTQEQINRHFEAVRRGAFRGKEAEQRAFEQELAIAGSEGRIR